MVLALEPHATGDGNVYFFALLNDPQCSSFIASAVVLERKILPRAIVFYLVRILPGTNKDVLHFTKEDERELGAAQPLYTCPVGMTVELGELRVGYYPNRHKCTRAFRSAAEEALGSHLLCDDMLFDVLGNVPSDDGLPRYL